MYFEYSFCLGLIFKLEKRETEGRIRERER